MADNRDEFSEKVLAKLKEKNRAIDLTEEEIVETAKSEPEIVAQSEKITQSGHTEPIQQF